MAARVTPFPVAAHVRTAFTDLFASFLAPPATTGPDACELATACTTRTATR